MLSQQVAKLERVWVGRCTVKAGGKARLNKAALDGRQLLAQQRHIRVPALRVQRAPSTPAYLSIGALGRSSTCGLCNHQEMWPRFCAPSTLARQAALFHSTTAFRVGRYNLLC